MILLRTLAPIFNQKVRGYTATVRETWASTDRKIAGTRLRHPGKGRKGWAITILNAQKEVFFNYDTSRSSYGSQKEAAAQIAEFWGEFWLPGVEPQVLVCRRCGAREDDKTRGRFVVRFSSPGCLCPKCGRR